MNNLRTVKYLQGQTRPKQIMYQKRSYRNLVRRDNLVSFNLTVQETDLLVHAKKNLEKITTDLVLKYRGYIEAYIKTNPEFVKTLKPWNNMGPVPMIVRDMTDAGNAAGVGPMAAVAGAVAEYVGLDLLSQSSEIIIENGGDVFLKTDKAATIGIFAGTSPLSMRIGLRMHSKDKPVSICTSSGTIGHSLSLGKADAVCAVSESGSLADASATAIANRVKSKNDINKAINFGKEIKGVKGIVVIVNDKLGLWGDFDIVRLKGKKG